MSLSKHKVLSHMSVVECWDVLSLEVREILTLLSNWRLAEFFKGLKGIAAMRWDSASTGDVSGPAMPWSARPDLHPYRLSSLVLHVLCFAWLSHGCWSGLVTQISTWLCHQAGACSAAPQPNCYQGAHPFRPHPVISFCNLLHQSIPLPPPLWHFEDDFER